MKHRQKHLLRVIISALFIVFPHVVFAQSFEYHHIHMWQFDEGWGRYADDVLGTAPGELLGENITWDTGKIREAVRLTGTPGEAVKLPNDLVPKGEGAIALWMKFDKLSDKNVVFSARSVVDHDIYMQFGVDALGRLEVRSRNGISGVETVVKSTGSVRPLEWQQVIVTVKNGRYGFYVGGTSVGSDQPAQTPGKWFSTFTSGSIEYRIGSSVATSRPGVWSGLLDDFCIFSVGFTASDASALYQGNQQYIAETAEQANYPELVFSASPPRVVYGGTTTLEWRAKNVNSCTAQYGWTGEKSITGSMQTPPLTVPTLFLLTCTNGGAATISKEMIIDVGEMSDGLLPPVPVDEIPASPNEHLVEIPPASTPTTDPNAKTIADLLATIAALQEELRKLTQQTAAAEPMLPEGCTEYLHAYLKLGAANDSGEVKKLQQFLNETIDAGLPVTGYFGKQTHAAVKRFQVSYHADIIKPWLDIGYKASEMSMGTGYVYKTTRYQINLMKCATLGVPKPVLERN